MPIHNFGSDFTVSGVGRQTDGTPLSPAPFGVSEHPPGVRQLSHAEGGRINQLGDIQAYPQHLEEFLMPGFWALDDAMKQYWSGIRVPTKDSYRFMRVKIAGGNKSLQIWADEMKEGRARLPVASISRDSCQFNPDKFSPPYHSMTGRYLSSRYDQFARVFRPTPWLVDYTMAIWTEHKRDAEYILYQTINRFNPLAEFRMCDGKIQGNVQLRFNGFQDASDKETGFDQHANVRYEFSMVAEAWLPLPEKIVKTVLGTVTNFKELTGYILLAMKGDKAYEPVQ